MVKVPVIELYAVPAEVEYLQVADSLVERDMVAWVVPAAREPVGLPLDLVGAVVSTGGVPVCFIFPESADIINDDASTISKSFAVTERKVA